MIKTPYLVQRGTINKPLADSSTRLSNAVDLDYMGSSEFEFGALPRSLRTLQANIEKIKKTVFTSIKKGDTPLKVIHFLSHEELAEYEGQLLKMREGKLRLKEGSRFEAVSTFKWSEEINFWWDIENHVMWSFEKDFMNRLPDYLTSSWKYMDEKK